MTDENNIASPEPSEHRVLVVDDNPATLYSTSRLLRSAGYETVEATSGGAALELADGATSAIVLDVHLPDMDGFEVCRRLRARDDTSRVPLIHLSALYVRSEDKVRGLDKGADAYLTHPIEPSVLVATVNALIRARVAEHRMRESEARFRAIYDHATSGICVLDDNGTIVEANPAFVTLLGLDRADIVGRSVDAFAATKGSRFTDHLSGDPLAPWRGEFALVEAAGETVHLEWSVSPRIAPGRRIATLANVSDRVNLALRREQLLEQEQAARASAERIGRMKDEFIAVLSHELRTPLNAISGWTHVLKTVPDPSPQITQAIAAIERNSRIQTRLIADMLDLSRLNTGKLNLEREMVVPAELVRSALASMQSVFDEKQLRVQVAAESSVRPMWLDASRFQQILWNLLSNAAKFSKARGVISVTLFQDSDALALTVEDQGQGIAPEFMPYLFDRFSQSQSVTNRLQGGLGLGLSIVKHLAELHGGSVSARSEGTDKGASFEVRIPVTEPFAKPASTPSHPKTEEQADAPRLVGVDVLVVDDDSDAGTMLRLILTAHGCAVRLATNVDEAMKSLEERRPDLLISDIGLPGKDGYDLIRALRSDELVRHLDRLPSIALTAFARPKDSELALRAGFDAHCPKPFQPHRLLSVVAELTGKA